MKAPKYIYILRLGFYLHQKGKQNSVHSEGLEMGLEDLSGIVHKSLKMIRCEIL